MTRLYSHSVSTQSNDHSEKHKPNYFCRIRVLEGQRLKQQREASLGTSKWDQSQQAQAKKIFRASQYLDSNFVDELLAPSRFCRSHFSVLPLSCLTNVVLGRPVLSLLTASIQTNLPDTLPTSILQPVGLDCRPHTAITWERARSHLPRICSIGLGCSRSTGMFTSCSGDTGRG